MLVEYASLVAALAVLTSTLSGTYGKHVAALPTSGAAAIRLVNAGARAQHVSPAGARAAYARAPYRRPVLKYLYAAGWIGGTKNPASCIYVLGETQDAQIEAVRELRHNAKVVRQLRRLHVPVRVGAAALVKGLVSACS